MTTDGIEYRFGELPLILTAPHGGKTVIDTRLTERVRPTDANIKFSTTSDLYTFELMQEIDSYICNSMKLKPYYVGLKVHRKYVDANRAPSQSAYNQCCKQSKSLYDMYHGLIEQCTSSLIEKYPLQRVLLIDIHGAKFTVADYKPRTIAIGTCNGSSFPHVDKNLPHKGFLWRLREMKGGVHVVDELLGYTGGYTVQV